MNEVENGLKVLGPVERNVDSAIHRIVIFSNGLPCSVTEKIQIKVQYFQVKDTCELNIFGVLAFYTFLAQLKNHYPLDSAIQLSCNRPLMCIRSRMR